MLLFKSPDVKKKGGRECHEVVFTMYVFCLLNWIWRPKGLFLSFSFSFFLYTPKCPAFALWTKFCLLMDWPAHWRKDGEQTEGQIKALLWRLEEAGRVLWTPGKLIPQPPKLPRLSPFPSPWVNSNPSNNRIPHTIFSLSRVAQRS